MNLFSSNLWQRYPVDISKKKIGWTFKGKIGSFEMWRIHINFSFKQLKASLSRLTCNRYLLAQISVKGPSSKQRETLACFRLSWFEDIFRVDVVQKNTQFCLVQVGVNKLQKSCESKSNLFSRN